MTSRPGITVKFWDFQTGPYRMHETGVVTARTVLFLPDPIGDWQLRSRFAGLASTEGGWPSPALQLLLGYHCAQNVSHHLILDRLVLKEILKEVGCYHLLWSDLPHTDRPRWDVYVDDGYIRDNTDRPLGKYVENLHLLGVANHLARLSDVIGFLGYRDVQHVIWVSRALRNKESGYDVTLYQRNPKRLEWGKEKDQVFGLADSLVSFSYSYGSRSSSLAEVLLHDSGSCHLAMVPQIGSVLQEISAVIKAHLTSIDLEALRATLRGNRYGAAAPLGGSRWLD